MERKREICHYSLLRWNRVRLYVCWNGIHTTFHPLFRQPGFCRIGGDHFVVDLLRIGKLLFQLFYALQKTTADDIRIHCSYPFRLILCTNSRFTENGWCKSVLKIVQRLPDHRPSCILHGYPFSGWVISNFKDELIVDTLGLGNKWMCVRDKHSSRYNSSGRNGIYVGNVVCGNSLLPATICWG